MRCVVYCVLCIHDEKDITYPCHRSPPCLHRLHREHLHLLRSYCCWIGVVGLIGSVDCLRVDVCLRGDVDVRKRSELGRAIAVIRPT